MDEPQFRILLDAACKLGDDHAKDAIKHARDAELLRTMIRAAHDQLCIGRIAKARAILERAMTGQGPWPL